MTEEREDKEDRIYFKNKDEVLDYLLNKKNNFFAFYLNGIFNIFDIKEYEAYNPDEQDIDYGSLERILWH